MVKCAKLKIDETPTFFKYIRDKRLKALDEA